jgi:hypothetical protein
MKIRVTFIADPSISKVIGKTLIYLENALNQALKDSDYGSGVKQVTFFYVSVFSNTSDNIEYCKKYNQTGKFKDIESGKMVSYIGIAIPISPEIILSDEISNVPEFLIGALEANLENPTYELPKKFDQKKFFLDIKSANDVSRLHFKLKEN